MVMMNQTNSLLNLKIIIHPSRKYTERRYPEYRLWRPLLPMFYVFKDLLMLSNTTDNFVNVSHDKGGSKADISLQERGSIGKAKLYSYLTQQSYGVICKQYS